MVAIKRSIARILKPKTKFKAIRKKESKEVTWVLKHLRTKPEVKSQDSVDGATENEVTVRAFGEIEFKGATKRAKSNVSLNLF